MREIVACLYVLSAVLPLIGLARLFFLARAEAKPVRDATPSASGKGVSHAEVQAGMPALVASVRDRPKAVAFDLGFIGLGVLAGVVASIWSLYLS